MPGLNALAGQSIRWRPPGAAGDVYLLRVGDEPVAGLRFTRGLDSAATAECAGGCWLIQRAHPHATRVLESGGGADAVVAVLRRDAAAVARASAAGGAAILALPDGRELVVRANPSWTAYEFAGADGRLLASFKTGGIWHMAVDITVVPAAAGARELPWIVLLGWYLAIMLHRDLAAAASVVGPIK